MGEIKNLSAKIEATSGMKREEGLQVEPEELEWDPLAVMEALRDLVWHVAHLGKELVRDSDMMQRTLESCAAAEKIYVHNMKALRKVADEAAETCPDGSE